MLAEGITISNKSFISFSSVRRNAVEHWNIFFTLVLYSAFSTGLDGTLKPSTAESRETLVATKTKNLEIPKEKIN